MISKLKLIVASAALVGLTATAFANHSMPPRKAAVLAKFDANNNGTLDPAEKLQLREARKAMRDRRIEKRFAKLDANGDGVVTLAEMKATKAKAKAKSKGKGKRRGMIR